MFPTYHEADTIAEVLRRRRAMVSAADLLVVDDASPDGTAAMPWPEALSSSGWTCGCGLKWSGTEKWTVGEAMRKSLQMAPETRPGVDRMRRRLGLSETGTPVWITERRICRSPRGRSDPHADGRRPVGDRPKRHPGPRLTVVQAWPALSLDAPEGDERTRVTRCSDLQLGLDQPPVIQGRERLGYHRTGLLPCDRGVGGVAGDRRRVLIVGYQDVLGWAGGSSAWGLVWQAPQVGAAL